MAGYKKRETPYISMRFSSTAGISSRSFSLLYFRGQQPTWARRDCLATITSTDVNAKCTKQLQSLKWVKMSLDQDDHPAVTVFLLFTHGRLPRFIANIIFHTPNRTPQTALSCAGAILKNRPVCYVSIRGVYYPKHYVKKVTRTEWL